jgi:hypothetical protein
LTIPETIAFHAAAVNSAATAVDAARAAHDTVAELAAVAVLESAAAAQRAFLKSVGRPSTEHDLPGDSRSLRYPRGI